MCWRKGTPNRRLGQCRAVDFDDGHVDFARAVDTLTPDCAAISVQQHRDAGRLGHAGVVDVQLDLHTIREMVGRLVEHYMAAVTRKTRPSRSKKNPLALVSARWPAKVSTRAAVSNSDSITSLRRHRAAPTSASNSVAGTRLGWRNRQGSSFVSQVRQRETLAHFHDGGTAGLPLFPKSHGRKRRSGGKVQQSGSGRCRMFDQFF
jgi:hypothetical protein